MRLHPKDLKVGDVFYECAAGYNLEMNVVDPIVYENEQWKWVAEDVDRNRVNYLITDGYEHYGPRIYKEPQYIDIRRDVR